jgi:hypothetical protein
MNGERTEKCLRQVEHIRGHLWQIYLGSVAPLLAATLYQGNPDRNHKLWNIVSTERYILQMQVLLSYYTRLLKVKIILNSSRNKKINKKKQQSQSDTERMDCNTIFVV